MKNPLQKGPGPPESAGKMFSLIPADLPGP
jgi:hypothetical protein